LGAVNYLFGSNRLIAWECISLLGAGHYRASLLAVMAAF
jgi:hypothetical protein